MYRGSYKGKPVAVKVVSDARHVKMINGACGLGLQLGLREAWPQGVFKGGQDVLSATSYG